MEGDSNPHVIYNVWSLYGIAKGWLERVAFNGIDGAVPIYRPLPDTAVGALNRLNVIGEKLTLGRSLINNNNKRNGPIAELWGTRSCFSAILQVRPGHFLQIIALYIFKKIKKALNHVWEELGLGNVIINFFLGHDALMTFLLSSHLTTKCGVGFYVYLVVQSTAAKLSTST